ncbi:MAG: DUF1398 family protein [Polyangiales bacterium]
MNDDVTQVIEACARAAYEGTLKFPEILQKLTAAGVEGYYTDLRRATNTYYLPNGESAVVTTHDVGSPVAARFDAAGVEAAVRRSQKGQHSYREFCREVVAAGCAGYLVSLLGRRVIYIGRTAESHVESFPGSTT